MIRDVATRTLTRPAVPARVAPLSRATTGSLALAGLVGAAALLALTAAAGPSPLVSTFRTMPHYFPAWLAGPLHAIGIPGSQPLRIGLVVAFCACYAAALRCAAALSSRRLWTAIVLAHVAVALAPPLLSGDVFGYIGFARLESLHGLSPYAFTANAAPADAIHPLLGWKDVTTPYGPLFTLLIDGARAAGDRGRPLGAEGARRAREPRDCRPDLACRPPPRPRAAQRRRASTASTRSS